MHNLHPRVLRLEQPEKTRPHPHPESAAQVRHLWLRVWQEGVLIRSHEEAQRGVESSVRSVWADFQQKLKTERTPEAAQKHREGRINSPVLAVPLSHLQTVLFPAGPAWRPLENRALGDRLQVRHV